MMRGTDGTSGSLFSYVDLEARIPARRPRRQIRQVVNEALASLDGDLEALSIDIARRSIAPERLTLLAPDVVEAILEGKQGPGVSLASLVEPFPLMREEQAVHF